MTNIVIQGVTGDDDGTVVTFRAVGHEFEQAFAVHMPSRPQRGEVDALILQSERILLRRLTEICQQLAREIEPSDA